MPNACDKKIETLWNDVPSLLLKQAFSEALRRNRGGADCLESFEPERAVERFSMAFCQHKRVLELLPLARSEHRRASSRTSVEIESVGNYETGGRNENNLSNSNGNNTGIHNDIDINLGIDIGRDMVNWFVRNQSHVILFQENGEWREEEREEDVLCYEPIRLSLETEEGLVSMMSAHVINNDHRTSEESVSNAMSLLTTVHAYNLGVANHLCGLRLLRSGNSAATAEDSHRNRPRSSSNIAATIPATSENSSLRPSFFFIQAERMYDFARRMERSRTKDDHNCTNSRRRIAEEASRITIVLACLNNLADLFRRNNQIVRCLQYYRQIKVITEELLELLNHHRGVECLLRSYLRAFLTKARDALSRLRRRNSSSTNTNRRRPRRPRSFN